MLFNYIENLIYRIVFVRACEHVIARNEAIQETRNCISVNKQPFYWIASLPRNDAGWLRFTRV